VAPRVLRLAEVSAEEALAAFVATAGAGGLLLFPTETVYGLGARADREESVQRIFQAKSRSAAVALPVLVGSRQQVRRVVAKWPPAAEALAQAFWPGPLTIVVSRGAGLSPLVTAGKDTVGVRMPDYPPLLAWLAACDFPLATTSANLSGEPAAAQVAELAPDLLAAVELLLDGGPCPGGVPSTVVDASSSPPRLLRPGPICEQDILRAAAKVV
jgi:L-threonylcarbamoyladenylate synthase